MRLSTATSLTGAVLLLMSAPAERVAAQGPALTPGEAEAREMSMQLGVGCSPRRHNSAPMQDSESLVDRGSETLPGTAAFFRNIDGTFLVLEGYDEEYNGHCLVFGWFGPPPAPGSYRIRPLSFEVLESELRAQDHSFFGMSAIRTQTENSVLVVASGTLEIDEMSDGAPSGTFELTGFRVEGADRYDDVTWSGSFRAARATP